MLSSHKNSIRRSLQRQLHKILSVNKVEHWRGLGAQIGDQVFIGFDAAIDEEFAPLLTIENGAVISARTFILLHDSAYNNLLGLPIKVGRVTIGEKAYIGANTTILCGVQIGKFALIGAGALIQSDIPERSVAVGNPARVIGTLDDFSATYQRDMVSSDKIDYLEIPAWRDLRESSMQADGKALKQAVISRLLKRSSKESIE